MLRTFFILLILSACKNVIAQSDTNQANLAKVNVFVTDMKGKPSRGEQILFKGNNNQKNFSGISDAAGRFSLQLPVGDVYVVKVKSLTDTTKYGTVNIPTLGPDEIYTEPFKVNVKFEPAKTYTLDNVHFDFGKATLRPESFGELEELITFLKNKDNIKIEIGGHTDNVGKEEDNLRLSQQRADAIRNYVVKKGIVTTRIIAKGYGATQPIADNDTDEGRQLNRRTEVRIL